MYTLNPSRNLLLYRSLAKGSESAASGVRRGSGADADEGLGFTRLYFFKCFLGFIASAKVY